MSAKQRVLVAMSGGVDSSVTAYLLQQQGCECVGATMRLACAPAANGIDGAPKSTADIEDAQAVAKRLGIPHHVIDLHERFGREVIDRFVSIYEAGATPNPCVICNRHIKFGALLDCARELGCDFVATGHYAHVTRAEDGVFELHRGLDPKKDQSYVLYSLTQDRLAHVLFPLAGLDKERDVRRIAKEQGFGVASKAESEDICFIPDGDYASYIERRTGRPLEPGNILWRDGSVVGTHAGALRYTIGQRKGLGVAMARPVYVTSVDMASNTVQLGELTDLQARALLANDWIWSAPAERMESRLDAGGIRVAAKYRYHQRDRLGTLTRADGALRLTFDEPQRAIAPGQAVVVYQDDLVLGGGTVVAAEH